MLVRPEIVERVARQGALLDSTQAADVDDRIDRAVGVGLDRGRQRVGAAGIEEVGEWQEPLVGDAAVRIEADDASEVGPLMPQLRSPVDFVEHMAVGPAIMAAGVLWLTRVPATSSAWDLQPGNPASWPPSSGYLLDFLPAAILFGLGIAITVAPLTTALMVSVPENRAGLGSAVNNAISRVGPQLAGALIFVAITGAFYADLSNRAPGIDTSSPEIRREISPLNRPDLSVSPTLVAAAGEASTDSFHIAMGLAAGLLLAGAVVNGLGIRDRQTQPVTEASEAFA